MRWNFAKDREIRDKSGVWSCTPHINVYLHTNIYFCHHLFAMPKWLYNPVATIVNRITLLVLKFR